MFLTYVIKVDKREVLRLYFKHIYVLSLFSVSPGKLPLCSQSEELWLISHFCVPGSGQLDIFGHMSSKLIKEKYLGYILNIFVCFSGF